MTHTRRPSRSASRYSLPVLTSSPSAPILSHTSVDGGGQGGLRSFEEETARESFKRGYRTTLISDAVSTYAPDLQAAVLKNFAHKFGWVSTAKDVIAEEAQRWLDRHKFKSVRLITSDWHMRRAGYEFDRVLGTHYRIVQDGVRSEPSFLTLFGEYNKYVLRRVAACVR